MLFDYYSNYYLWAMTYQLMTYELCDLLLTVITYNLYNNSL